MIKCKNNKLANNWILVLFWFQSLFLDVTFLSFILEKMLLEMEKWIKTNISDLAKDDTRFL